MRVIANLPILVLGAVERLTVRLRIDVEDVAARPGRRVGLVAVGAHAPLVGMRHRIHRDPPQELQLHAGGVVVLGDAVDQDLEAGGIILAAGRQIERRDDARIGRVLELVDRHPHLAQRAPQLGLALALDADLGQRHDRRRQDQEDRAHDEQLDEREAALAELTPCHEPRHCRSYLTVTVTGAKVKTTGACVGSAPTPVTEIAVEPGAMASISRAASSPAPDAPVWSPVRESAISTRPAAASMRGVNEAVTPPCRMNRPSWTVRTRSTAGL